MLPSFIFSVLAPKFKKRNTEFFPTDLCIVKCEAEGSVGTITTIIKQLIGDEKAINFENWMSSPIYFNIMILTL